MIFILGCHNWEADPSFCVDGNLKFLMCPHISQKIYGSEVWKYHIPTDDCMDATVFLQDGNSHNCKVLQCRITNAGVVFYVTTDISNKKVHVMSWKLNYWQIPGEIWRLHYNFSFDYDLNSESVPNFRQENVGDSTLSNYSY